MPRTGLIGFGVTLGVGLLALAAVAELEHKAEAFTLGVLPGAPVVRLGPDQEICQLPIDVPEQFQAVRLQLGTYFRPGSPYLLEVRGANDETLIARQRVSGGYRDNAVQTIALPSSVREGSEVAVCIHNLGTRAIAPYGNSGVSNRGSAAYLNGRVVEGDMTLVFLRADEASILTLVPSIVERASLFHGAWTSPSAYWLLVAALLVAPALLAAMAVRNAVRDSF